MSRREATWGRIRRRGERLLLDAGVSRCARPFAEDRGSIITPNCIDVKRCALPPRTVCLMALSASWRPSNLQTPRAAGVRIGEQVCVDMAGASLIDSRTSTDDGLSTVR